MLYFTTSPSTEGALEGEGTRNINTLPARGIEPLIVGVEGESANPLGHGTGILNYDVINNSASNTHNKHKNIHSRTREYEKPINGSIFWHVLQLVFISQL